MKCIHLMMVLMASFVVASVAHAEIYKWKDKEGNIRYSDTPPPSNTKLEAISGKKSAKPTGKEPLSIVGGQQAPVTAKEALPEGAPVTQNPEDTAAEQRRRTAEAEKNNKQEKESQAKLKAENCKAAKANLASYAQGGRVYKMNDKGEREYLDDAGLKRGADKASAEVSEYCN